MADFNHTINTRSVQRALSELADMLDRPDTYTGIIEQTLNPVAANIANKTPSESGQLRDSTRVEVGPPPSPTQLPRISEPVRDGTVALGLVGWDFEGARQNLRPRAIAREFGTRYQPAEPVLVPELMSQAGNMERNFADGLANMVEQLANQISRRN